MSISTQKNPNEARARRGGSPEDGCAPGALANGQSGGSLSGPPALSLAERTALDCGTVLAGYVSAVLGGPLPTPDPDIYVSTRDWAAPTMNLVFDEQEDADEASQAIDIALDIVADTRIAVTEPAA